MTELARLALVGIVGGIAVFVPVAPVAALLQRRRFGRVRPTRLAAIAAICIYTMALAGLTIAPAYEIAATCRNRVGGELRAEPFAAVARILEVRAGGASLLEVATSWPMMQLLANIALFVPLGMILRGVFRLDTTTTLAIGLMLSVLIEVTQYTGAWGLYPCGVRIADIDDVFTNAAGAWIGALCAPLLTRLGVPLFGREERHWPESLGGTGAGGGAGGDGGAGDGGAADGRTLDDHDALFGEIGAQQERGRRRADRRRAGRHRD